MFELFKICSKFDYTYVGSAKSAVRHPTGIVTAEDLNVIVRTFLLVLQIERNKHDVHVIARRRLYGPIAIRILIVFTGPKLRVGVDVLPLARGLQVATTHRAVGGMESLPVHRSIRLENYVHLVASGHCGRGVLLPAHFPHAAGFGRAPVVDDDVVVRALLVGLDFEAVEYDLDPVAGGGDEVPHAFLLSGVVVGEAGAGEFPVGAADFVLAPSLLAASAVFFQNEPVVARAQVRTDGVQAVVLTAAVVYGAFV